VFDGCRWDGVLINVTGPLTAAQIVNNYMGVSNATGPTSSCVHILNSHGSVIVANNQGLAVLNNPANGIYVSGSSGVKSSNNIWTDLAKPVYLENTVSFRIEDEINVALVPCAVAIEMVNCQYGKIDSDIRSSNPALSIGTAVKMTGALNACIEVNGTGIYTPSLTDGSVNNKLNANNAAITASGLFNAGRGANCLYSGLPF
jgi:hypothetical protein